jgi:hypothetical protein
MNSVGQYSISSIIIMIVVVGFFLNLLWEVAHSMLYDWDKPPLVNNIYKYIPRIIGFATLLDAVWIFTFLLWNSLLQSGFQWLYDPTRGDYLVLVILGIIYAIVIEVIAVVFNMWSYNRYMPVILGIGLSPLLQLAFTSVLSLYIITTLVLRV